MGVIEQLYTEVEVRQRKMGDSLAGAGKMNMPDITFAYFLQKYGRKNLVDEYVGSLVNTLERFREVSNLNESQEWLISPRRTRMERMLSTFKQMLLSWHFSEHIMSFCLLFLENEYLLLMNQLLQAWQAGTTLSSSCLQQGRIMLVTALEHISISLQDCNKKAPSHAVR